MQYAMRRRGRPEEEGPRMRGERWGGRRTGFYIDMRGKSAGRGRRKKKKSSLRTRLAFLSRIVNVRRGWGRLAHRLLACWAAYRSS